VRPPNSVTLDEAGRILGRSVSGVRRFILTGRLVSHGSRYEHRTLSRAEVEGLAAEVYDWRRHAEDPESYWLGSHEAAGMLGVSRQRLAPVIHDDGHGLVGVA